MSASTLTLAAHTQAHAALKRRSHRLVVPLGRYRQADGLARELVLLPGAGGSKLIVDRLADGLGNRRLLAHLAADEPAVNAQIVCRGYLAEESRRSRRLAAADFAVAAIDPPRPDADPFETELTDRDGCHYRLQAVDVGRRKLSWTRLSDGGAWQPITLKDLIGALESYDPALEITRSALARETPRAAKGPLAAQLARVEVMAVVLNRGLREALLYATTTTDLTISEVAIRCGRVKHRRDGRISGETSWLARRVGLAADSATGKPTPWVRPQTLALIARKGLHLAPAEVEIGSALRRHWSAGR